MKLTAETLEKQAVKQYLRLKRCFFFYNLAGLGSFPGIPDMFCIKDGICYALEIKMGKRSRQSEHQKNFQKSWEENGGIYICGNLNDVMKIIK